MDRKWVSAVKEDGASQKSLSFFDLILGFLKNKTSISIIYLLEMLESWLAFLSPEICRP